MTSVQPQTLSPQSYPLSSLLYEIACEYVNLGFSVVPTDPVTKAPVVPWKDYQTRLPTQEELVSWFITKGFQGIGIVCGAISGGLEILDFDLKAELYQPWCELVEDAAPGLIAKFPVGKTQNNGRHLIFRCPDIQTPGSAKLAQRKVEDEIKTLIETRGEGGQFLAPPTAGYDFLQGDFTTVPVITPEERQMLIDAALALNEFVCPKQTEGAGHRRPKGTERPGDAFNERGDVAALLEKHGWTQVRENGMYQHWRRPGKTKGQSASLVEEKIFYVFSQNASPFEAGNAYSPFAVYTLLEHAGDYLAAAQALAQEGYGESTVGDASTGTDWPTPEPLRRPPEPPEPFPLEALGKILYPAAQSIHEIIKAPAAICGQAVLAIANLTVQGHANVIMDGRRIPLSEYLMSIALSGERKTGCDRAASVPVYDYERELLEVYKKDFRVYEKEALLWKKEHEAALKKSKDRREALEALSSPPIPPYYPQLTTEEPTYEGLTKSLGHGHPSIGIFSDEAGRFLGGYAMNQENKLKTIAGLSALWDGRPITRTRSADGSITLYGRRVCAHLLMQPLVAETILSDPLAHDQGFLSRCLITAPETTLGTQTYSAKDLNRETGYKRYCDKLADILRTKLPLKIDSDTGHPTNELIPRDLLVSPEGKEVWIRFHDWVQEHLGERGVFRSISGIAAKAAEHALRLAGTIALVEDIDTSTISFENIKAGIVLARFYLTEALRLFHAAKTNPDLLLAEKVFSWLKTRGSNHQLFSLPCIYQNGPNGVRDKATAARCVTILADHGWVRPLAGGAKIEGKRRRYVWEVRPDA